MNSGLFVCLARLFGVTSLEMRKALERERCGEISEISFLTVGAQGTYLKSRQIFNKQLYKPFRSLCKESKLEI